MHLDTVFTLCDRDLVNMFPGVTDGIKCFSLRPGGSSDAPFDITEETGSDSSDLDDFRFRLQFQIVF